MPGGPGAQWRPEWGAGPQGGYAESPVPEHETRVTGRRVVQYIIDSILAGIIPGILFALVRDNTHGVVRGLTWLIAAAVWVVIMVWYWVIRPHGKNGQTFGMQLLGVRVISKDGAAASMTQLFVRWLALVLDSVIWFFVIVDFIVILCSRYRQRIGDHMAKTIVIRTERGFASSGSRTGAAAMTQPGSAGTTGNTGQAGPAQGSAGDTMGPTGHAGTTGPAGSTDPAGPGR